MREDRLKAPKIVILSTVITLVVFGAGVYVGARFTPHVAAGEVVNIVDDGSNTVSSTTVNMAPFWTVWNDLDQKFVATHKNEKLPSEQDKLWGAIQGMAAAYGDPYTVFMPPVESNDFNSNISGDFEGVGMELAADDAGDIVVVAPLKGTPAYAAGIKTGDILLSINGTSTANMDVDTAVGLIRGKAGTTVDLTFDRAGSSKPLDIKLMRAVINIPTIDTETKGDIFVIHLYNFYEPSANDFRGALRDFVQSGKSKLVLDLRGNPGGYLDAAVDMASWFLPLNDVVVRENFGSSTPENVYRSKGYNVFNNNLKMVILANQGSASAAEILSGALQEHGVAKLVGTRTFGKGSVQELLPITSDTSLKVTVARWLTPDGISISDNGLTPDYNVPMTDADVAAGKDPQMDKAIELLDQQ
ncbi:MAG: S41 family peptidase [Patescibacteria group bacterium]|nr:S41 family peptidase [Patescibacteria group bacterium]MDE1945939.1 S41 family peptidase [Patescibacteria group bacterium]